MESVEGVWAEVRATEKAVRLVREDGHERWFPKSAVAGPDGSGALKVAGWLLAKEPFPPLRETPLALPPGGRGRWRRGAFSFSRAKTMLACPRAYHFGRERRLPGRLSQALGFGNTVHAALEGIFACDFTQASPAAYLEGLVGREWERQRAQFQGDVRRLGRWDESRRSDAVDQARWALERLTGGRFSAEGIAAARPLGLEMAVFSQDGAVGGYVDALVARGGKVVAIDYKTGKVPAAGIPDDHRLQGLLYAHLLAEERGSLPDAVEFWYVSGQAVETITPDAEAVAGAAAMVAVAREAALALAGQPEEAWEARPATDTCRHCDYRPWCEPFRKMAAKGAMEEGYGQVVGGRVTAVAAAERKRPAVAILALAGGGELPLKAWGAAARRLESVVVGQEVLCVDARVVREGYTDSQAATVSDPYAILVGGVPMAVPPR
ncbi:PD-(D/E)XK nuclease family protein [bacterium]|nr:PD-(D/E)XK nuclease family protein [bacterium]